MLSHYLIDTQFRPHPRPNLVLERFALGAHTFAVPGVQFLRVTSISLFFTNPLHHHPSNYRVAEPEAPLFLLSSQLHDHRTFATAMAQSSSSPVEQLERITVVNGYGEKLAGVLHETGSKELVILCHGFTASKDDKIMKNLADALTKEGISVCRFDFAGNGESEGQFQYGHYQREADDLHAVVQYFLGLNREVKAVVGHSKGGDVVLLYASRHHDVPIVVNASGRYDLSKGIQERLGEDFMERIKKDGFIDAKNKKGTVLYRATEESLMERLSIDMHSACLSIDKNCRVLTVHGSMDEIIPVEDAFEFNKIIPNHTLHIVEGADHLYSKHQADLAEAVVEFIKADP